MKKNATQSLFLFLSLFCSFAVFANQITVCNSGCGYTTIQAAVNAAAAGDTVLINITGAITETGITISKNLTLRGLGQSTTFVQGSATRGTAAHRVFYVNAGTVVLENLTIQNGREASDPTIWNGSGSGILIEGTNTTVTLNSVSVKNCDNVGSGGAGAGVTLAGTNTYLYLNNCVLDGNIANNGSAGALYTSNGSVTARNTSFLNNAAAQGSGGAVFLGGTVIASFINCTFTNNGANNGNSGGAIYASSAIPTFYNCTFNNNVAGNMGGAMRIGGANITNCTFFGNTALNGGAISRGTGAATNPLYIVNCTMAGNSATGTAPVGAGLQNASGTAVIHMVNTVIANSMAGSDLYLNTASTLSTNQKNYVGTASFTSGTTTFAYSSTANLAGALANNGGLTQTLATNAGSVLINNGIASVTGITIPTKDQRNLPINGTIDIGAYENGATESMAINYTTLGGTSSLLNRALAVTIADNAGVPTSGSFMPKLYYKKNSGNWVSVAGTLASGSATSGTWNFTIDNTLLGGVANSDVISYFITAQDVTTGAYGKSNSTGLVAGSVNAVTTAPTSLNSYSISVSTLPIRLLSFEATKKGTDATVLSWKTAEDADADHYELLKSKDGLTYTERTRVASNNVGIYFFTDEKTAPVQYYQLRMIEKTGAVTYSSILSVRWEDITHAIQLQTNLVTGNSLSLQFPKAEGRVQYTITDRSGQLIGRGDLKVDAASLQNISIPVAASGTYYLRLSFSGQEPSIVLPFHKQ